MTDSPLDSPLGRDPRAIRIRATPGAAVVDQPRSAAVIGGGIAGIAAAIGLAERGVQVHLIEPETELGGRVRAWEVDSDAGRVTMSRGFHAFFRQYYNLRSLLRRTGGLSGALRPVADYPVISASGDEDSFAKIPRKPPWNFISFVAQSPTFTARDLTQVDLDAALSLLDVDFPGTYRELEHESAADFLDRLRFPDRARHLALEVFARSFFADPRDFSAGELVAMFHTYFLGSAEGLLFDLPRDDFDTSLWAPLGKALEGHGAQRLTGEVTHLRKEGSVEQDSTRWVSVLADGREIETDAVVLAAGPRATPQIVAGSPIGEPSWRSRVAAVQLAPPFAVLRLWLDRQVNSDRPPFLGTTGFGILDNISVFERFESGAARWAHARGGSVVELHAYAIDAEHDPADVRAQLLTELHQVYPETRSAGILAEELRIDADCPLIGTGSWEARPEVSTPEAGVKLAGDWVRCDLPIALMERAATTGFMAANDLLSQWGARGHDLWSPPTAGRHRLPGRLRSLLAKVPGTSG